MNEKMLIEQAETLQKIDQLVTAQGVCSYAFARFDVSDPRWLEKMLSLGAGIVIQSDLWD